jgi:bacterial leucyl aminopeptidase
MFGLFSQGIGPRPQPRAPFSQTLSATYTLPTGTLQAVRARFRYNGSDAACGTGAYDDHDDLIFAVNP